jgi:hypothetical protein
VAWTVNCSPGATDAEDYSGVVNLPVDAGGDLFADAGCAGSAGADCDVNGLHSTWAETQIGWAHLLLSASVSPTASGFSGSALQRGVRGTGHVVFTAGESSGPGIYAVAVSIDGRLAWAGTPNPNGGECVPVGTDPTSAALMFDHEQPCLDSEVVDAPVPTAGLPDGPHELAISVTDAADNTSTVLDQTITTSNPQTTPAATGRRAIHATFVISWTWAGNHTRLRSISVHDLPRTGRLTVTCTGTGCPRLRTHTESVRHARTLLRELDGRRFFTGDHLTLAVTAPHHRTEHIQLQIRDDRLPLARLLTR